MSEPSGRNYNNIKFVYDPFLTTGVIPGPTPWMRASNLAEGQTLNIGRPKDVDARVSEISPVGNGHVAYIVPLSSFVEGEELDYRN